MPAQLRREVWERDQGRCAFIGEDGRRCSETRCLEYAHAHPWGKGGEHTATNVALKCRAHNAYEANRDYGEAFMSSKRGDPSRVREPLAHYEPSRPRTTAGSANWPRGLLRFGEQDPRGSKWVATTRRLGSDPARPGRQAHTESALGALGPSSRRARSARRLRARYWPRGLSRFGKQDELQSSLCRNPSPVSATNTLAMTSAWSARACTDRCGVDALESERTGVFSHETALALHQLSDALPAKAQLTLPSAWKARRLQVPSGVVLHFADLADADRAWAGAVQVTTAARTVIDCGTAGVSPGIVKQAIDEGMHRGLFTAAMIEPATEFLRSFEAGDS